METLKGTFGSNQMIVHKVIYSLRYMKVHHTTEQVSQLSFQLINAHDILTKMDTIGETNALTMLQDIVHCLPNFAQNEGRSSSLILSARISLTRNFVIWLILSEIWLMI